MPLDHYLSSAFVPPYSTGDRAFSLPYIAPFYLTSHRRYVVGLVRPLIYVSYEQNETDVHVGIRYPSPLLSTEQTSKARSASLSRTSKEGEAGVANTQRAAKTSSNSPYKNREKRIQRTTYQLFKLKDPQPVGFPLLVLLFSRENSPRHLSQHKTETMKEREEKKAEDTKTLSGYENVRAQTEPTGLTARRSRGCARDLRSLASLSPSLNRE
ncbi:hypothetical protein EYR40_006068 [Pleurotus pulmonarius]|nr:hypothetical protein EYR36_005553 [Pleurotus pulmonarius]KAF4602850.1 hypothetical protein EYR40_006068 [Pleurotus pulmonarius]